MKVKNSIKKVGAVAGSALVVGLSVGSAASLSDFPQPFVEDDGDVASQIVVGSTGQVADVVGAVNIAAALGQDVVQTEERETSGTGASVDVDGDTGTAEIRDGFDFNVGDDYSGFQFFEEYDEDDGLSVIEQASLSTGESDSTGSIVSSDVEAELGAEARLGLSQGELSYTADYVPSVAEGESLYLLGETWGVTGVSNGDIEIGEEMEHRNLAAGDELEHGDWTVEIIDVDRDNNRVRLDIYQDGDFVESKTLADGSGDGDYDTEDTFGDDDEFAIEVGDIWFGDQLDQVHLDTTLTTEELEHEEPFFQDEDWEVRTETSTDGDGNEVVDSVELVNRDDYVVVEDDDDAELDDQQRHALSPGDSIMGPNDYFEVENLGLESEDITEETVTFGEDLALEFTDHNNVETSLNLEDDILHHTENLEEGSEGYIIPELDDEDGIGVPVYVNVDTWDRSDSSTSEVDVTIEYGDADLEIDQEGEDLSSEITFSGPDFSFNVNLDNDLGSGNAFSYTPASQIQTSEYGLISVDEWDGSANESGAFVDVDAAGLAGLDAADRLRVSLAERDESGSSDSSIHALYEYDDSSSGLDEDTDVGEIAEVDADGDSMVFDDDREETITNYGSHVAFGDETELTLTHATEDRDHEVAIGDTESTEGTSGETYEAVTDQSDLPDMAQLDEDIDESDRMNNHLILVGGPAVNTLTEELHNDGDVDLSEVEDQQSGAVLEVVEDAFADGQHAMVVAGYGADDTRSASRYIAQHRTNEDALADADNRLVLSEADYPTEQ